MRVVIKIGTSTLTHITGNLNIRRVEQICKVISDVKNAGNEIIIVSSGAIAMGVGKLGMAKRPEELAAKQGAAAVGQCELMYVYDKLFAEYNHTVAQLLITGEDIHNSDRYANFSNTLDCLLEMGVVPIINENDTIATDEIVIGDNDTLGAEVAKSVKAELLLVLSDINGLYTADPHKDSSAKLIERVTDLNESIYALAGGKGSKLGTGGMVTKLRAARICIDCGCDMMIVNGDEPENIYKAVNGEAIGTRFTVE